MGLKLTKTSLDWAWCEVLACQPEKTKAEREKDAGRQTRRKEMIDAS